jgi:hypothetical protein
MLVEQVAEFEILAEHVEALVPAEALELGGAGARLHAGAEGAALEAVAPAGQSAGGWLGAAISDRRSPPSRTRRQSAVSGPARSEGRDQPRSRRGSATPHLGGAAAAERAALTSSRSPRQSDRSPYRAASARQRRAPPRTGQPADGAPHGRNSGEKAGQRRGARPEHRPDCSQFADSRHPGRPVVHHGRRSTGGQFSPPPSARAYGDRGDCFARAWGGPIAISGAEPRLAPPERADFQRLSPGRSPSQAAGTHHLTFL